MSIRTMCRLVGIVALFVVWAMPAAAGSGKFFFELSWNPATMTSSAFVHDTIVDADIAEVTGWEGKLPVGYDTTGEVSYVPTRVLGELRDQLENSGSPGAADALGWIRERMGEYSSTPVSEIPGNVLSAVLGAEKSWYCGAKAFPDGHCPSDCRPTDNPKTCSGCGCAGEKTFPEP